MNSLDNFASGNIGELLVMIGEAKASSEHGSSDEAAEHIDTPKADIGTKRLRDIWREPMALAVALGNLQKIAGNPLKVTLQGLSMESESLITEIVKETNGLVQVTLLNDETAVHSALRDVSQYLRLITLQ